MPDRTRAEQVALLRECIRRSGLSSGQFAERVMVRDPRTIRRWLSGKQTIPETALRRLRELGAFESTGDTWRLMAKLTQ